MRTSVTSSLPWLVRPVNIMGSLLILIVDVPAPISWTLNATLSHHCTYKVSLWSSHTVPYMQITTCAGLQYALLVISRHEAHVYAATYI